MVRIKTDCQIPFFFMRSKRKTFSWQKGKNTASKIPLPLTPNTPYNREAQFGGELISCLCFVVLFTMIRYRIQIISIIPNVEH